MPPAYSHLFRVRLHDTDAARVLFFSHLLRHAHDAYEGFLETLGFPLHDLIGNGDAAAAVSLPIIQAQARYLGALRLGDRVTVELRVTELRRRSFALHYRFVDETGQTRAEAETVHCLAGPDTEGLPAGLQAALVRAMQPDSDPT
jgi:1,4-dihydroxy-2-naphthoyl-CoA hydrolase